MIYTTKRSWPSLFFLALSEKHHSYRMFIAVKKMLQYRQVMHGDVTKLITLLNREYKLHHDHVKNMERAPFQELKVTLYIFLKDKYCNYHLLCIEKNSNIFKKFSTTAKMIKLCVLTRFKYL